MAKTKRVQVLMEPREFAVLERLARSRGASVADLMREAARAQYLNTDDRGRRARAAELFLKLPETALPEWRSLKEELEARRDPALP
jgi:hypothetical protein